MVPNLLPLASIPLMESDFIDHSLIPSALPPWPTCCFLYTTEILLPQGLWTGSPLTPPSPIICMTHSLSFYMSLWGVSIFYWKLQPPHLPSTKLPPHSNFFSYLCYCLTSPLNVTPYKGKIKLSNLLFMAVFPRPTTVSGTKQFLNKITAEWMNEWMRERMPEKTPQHTYLFTDCSCHGDWEGSDIASAQVFTFPLVAEEFQLPFLFLVQGVAIANLDRHSRWHWRVALAPEDSWSPGLRVSSLNSPPCGFTVLAGTWTPLGLGLFQVSLYLRLLMSDKLSKGSQVQSLSLGQADGLYLFLTITAPLCSPHWEPNCLGELWC